MTTLARSLRNALIGNALAWLALPVAAMLHSFLGLGYR